MDRRVLLCLLALLSACAGRTPSAEIPPAAPLALTAEFVVSPPAPNVRGMDRFGGLSGLAPIGDGAEVYAIADDRESPRFYRLRVNWAAGTIERIGAVPLREDAGAPAELDPEGIALTGDGRLFISSEGVGNREPRLPPAIVEYTTDGRFVRQLAVRPRFLPTATGALTRGVRENAGFESLTIAPDGRTLYTANEVPLVQDGPADAFAPGARIRILEYVAKGDTFVPAREFAYDIAPVEPQPFAAAYAVNGVVELLALGDGELLALERGYAEAANRTQSINRIRLFRVSLAGATDVSSLDTLQGAAAVTPVRKTLVLDLNTTAGLSERLQGLDNFEGLALGPPAGGARPLLVVSDDNFNPRQVTAFLFFRSH